jgi:hypothetical protein
MVVSETITVNFARDFAMSSDKNAERSPVVQSLQNLTDRLSAPDLTAAEAAVIRPRLFRLLDSLEPETPRRPSSPDDRKLCHCPALSRR